MITPAWNLTDAKLIKAKVSGQNEYIPATIKTIDYEVDLAILELEPNAMKKPLKPIRFEDKFQRGEKLNYYWLNASGEIAPDKDIWTAQRCAFDGLIRVFFESDSYEHIAGNVNGTGLLRRLDADGISCWSKNTTETGLIPAAIINSFLARAKDGNYPGVPAVGFTTEALLNLMTRAYLKMPATMKNGVQVVSVYNIGTGCDSLKAGDVILTIDGKEIDASANSSTRHTTASCSII